MSSPAEFRVAAKTWKFTGSRKRRRRKVNGVYARVYVLDQQGEYRTVASIEHLVGLAQFLPQARARVVDGGVFRTPRFCGRKVVARAHGLHAQPGVVVADRVKRVVEAAQFQPSVTDSNSALNL